MELLIVPQRMRDYSPKEVKLRTYVVEIKRAISYGWEMLRIKCGLVSICRGESRNCGPQGRVY